MSSWMGYGFHVEDSLTESCFRSIFVIVDVDDGKLSTAKEHGTDEKDDICVSNHEKLELERRIEQILCLPMDIWIILCTLQTLDMVMPLGIRVGLMGWRVDGLRVGGLVG
ncbi:hypothetical protein HanRHA438_Chr13g0623441 [Helianthus annuus]|nr:hypothetical protein HanRHA438_Chr13g0623441 [Helianthus annuus]